MKMKRLLSRVAGVIAVTLVLCGCGGAPPSGPGAQSPEPTGPFTGSASQVPVPPDWPMEPSRPAESGRAALPVPTETPSHNPRPTCEGGPFGCRTYTSVSGRDGTGELEWLHSQPLVMSSVFINGTWTIGVKTPCNYLSVEVSVEGSVLVPGNMISTAMACLGPESGFESWTHGLFQEPVSWELAGGSLVLKNKHGTVELTDSGPNGLR